MKSITFYALLLFCVFTLQAQNIQQRFIEVTGSAEMLIDPDEFTFIIGIQEYWKEEFEPKKEFEDYQTKVPINEIESQLIKDLTSMGITKENIKATEVGNSWRHRGKEFLIGKQIEIKLVNFNTINTLISQLASKGIDYMRIGELKNNNLSNYRREVKTKALLAAKDKASYLLQALDETLGNVISITEGNSDNFFWQPAMAKSNVMMNSPENSHVENEKKIKLRYEINVRFEIQ